MIENVIKCLSVKWCTRVTEEMMKGEKKKISYRMLRTNLREFAWSAWLIILLKNHTFKFYAKNLYPEESNLVREYWQSLNQPILFNKPIYLSPWHKRGPCKAVRYFQWTISLRIGAPEISLTENMLHSNVDFHASWR